MKNVLFILSAALSAGAYLLYEKGVEKEISVWLSIAVFQLFSFLSILLFTKPKFDFRALKNRKNMLVLGICAVLDISGFYILLDFISRDFENALFMAFFKTLIDFCSINLNNFVFGDTFQNPHLYWIGFCMVAVFSVAFKYQDAGGKGFTLNFAEILLLLYYLTVSILKDVLVRLVTTSYDPQKRWVGFLNKNHAPLKEFNFSLFGIEFAIAFVFFLMAGGTFHQIADLGQMTVITLCVIGLVTGIYTHNRSAIQNKKGKGYATALESYRIVPLYFLVQPLILFIFDKHLNFNRFLSLETIVVCFIFMGSMICFYRGKPNFNNPDQNINETIKNE